MDPEFIQHWNGIAYRCETPSTVPGMPVLYWGTMYYHRYSAVVVCGPTDIGPIWNITDSIWPNMIGG